MRDPRVVHAPRHTTPGADYLPGMPLLSRLYLAALLTVSGVGVLAAQRPTDRAPYRTVELHTGMVITSSVRIASGSYPLEAPASLDSAVTIAGCAWRPRPIALDAVRPRTPPSDVWCPASAHDIAIRAHPHP